MADLALGFGDEQPLPDIQSPQDVGTGLPTQAPANDVSLNLAMDSPAFGGGTVPQGQPLNLAPQQPRVQRTMSDKEYLDSLPTGEKIGLAMESFRAGYHGAPNPIDTLLANKRAKERQATVDLMGTMNVLQKGTEILRKLPAGSLQRQAVADELGKVVGPAFAPLFNAVGTEHDDAIKNYLDIFGDKDVQQMAVKQCSQSSDFGACILKLSTDDSWGKKAETVVDSKRLGTITQKMRVVAEQMKKQGKEQFTLADLQELNKDGSVFDFSEMQTIGRNESFWGDMGLKSRRSVQAGQETGARLDQHPERYPAIGSLQTIQNKDGSTTQQRFGGLDNDGQPIWEEVGGKGPGAAKGGLTAKQQQDVVRHDNGVLAAQQRLQKRGIDWSNPAAMDAERFQETVRGGIPNRSFIGKPALKQIEADLKQAKQPLRGEVPAKSSDGYTDSEGTPYVDVSRSGNTAPVAKPAPAPAAAPNQAAAAQVRADYKAKKITRQEAITKLQALGFQ